MKIQTGAQAPTGSACPNLACLYLFMMIPMGADLVLLIAIGVLLTWP